MIRIASPARISGQRALAARLRAVRYLRRSHVEAVQRCIVHGAGRGALRPARPLAPILASRSAQCPPAIRARLS